MSPPSPSVCFQPESLLRNFEFVAIVRWLESTFTFLSSLDHHIQLPICLHFYPLRRQLLLLFVILAVFWFILMPLANEDAEYLPFRSSNTFSASQKTCFSVCFKMGKEILKKKEETQAKKQIFQSSSVDKDVWHCQPQIYHQPGYWWTQLSRSDCHFTEDATGSTLQHDFLLGIAEVEPALLWTWNRWQREKAKAFTTCSYCQEFCNTFDHAQIICFTLVPKLTECSEIWLFFFIFEKQKLICSYLNILFLLSFLLFFCCCCWSSQIFEEW